MGEVTKVMLVAAPEGVGSAIGCERVVLLEHADRALQAVSLISLYAGNLHYYPLYLLLAPRRRSVERELVHIEDVNQPRNHTAAHSNDVVQLVSLVDVGLPVNLVRELCGNAGADRAGRRRAGDAEKRRAADELDLAANEGIGVGEGDDCLLLHRWSALPEAEVSAWHGLAEFYWRQRT